MCDFDALFSSSHDEASIVNRKDFGILLAVLRDKRGLSQDDLARAMGKTRDTVAKVEQGRADWPASTSLHAFNILNTPPLAQADAFAFLDYCDLDRAFYHQSAQVVPARAPLPPSAQAPQRKSHTTAEFAEILRLVGELIQHQGIDNAAAALKSIIYPNAPTSLTPPPIELRVTTPPRPSKTVPGAIEHTEVAYIPTPKSPRSIKRTKKSAG